MNHVNVTTSSHQYRVAHCNDETVSPVYMAADVLVPGVARSLHYCDVIMGTIASQITSLTVIYSTVYSDADQRKHQSSESLAFVRGIHRLPVNSPHKWPVTRKMFPFDDVIMRRHDIDWLGSIIFIMLYCSGNIVKLDLPHGCWNTSHTWVLVLVDTMVWCIFGTRTSATIFVTYAILCHWVYRSICMKNVIKKLDIYKHCRRRNNFKLWVTRMEYHWKTTSIP